MNKYEKFWSAQTAAGHLVETITNEPVGKYTFGRYGKFTIETADVCLLIAKLENVAPEMDAFTWMHETTFRNYSESNSNTKNNPNDEFSFYDVGSRQVNVGLTEKNIESGYISIKGLNWERITGTKAPLFNGDPIENARCGARILLRQGQSEIVGEKDKKRFVMFPALTASEWKTLDRDLKMERQVVAYTGPAARPARLESWKKFGPLFRRFFEEYQK